MNYLGTVDAARPAITVGLMTHNYGHFIGEGIESVLKQTCTDWELIVSDDASEDDTASVVAPYLVDQRIKYIRHDRPLGQGGNWGFLLTQGTAPIVATLHADDLWLPGAADLAVNAFSSNAELDLFYAAWFRRSANESRPKPDEPAGTSIDFTIDGRTHFRRHVQANPMLPSFTFLSRRVIKTISPPRRDLKMCVDVEYLFRVSLAAREVRASSERIGIYRLQSNSVTAKSNSDGTTVSEVERLVEEFPRHPDCLSRLTPLLHQTFVQSLSFSGFNSGIAEILHGSTEQGIVRARRALRRAPRLLLRPKIAAYWILLHSGKLGAAMIRRFVTPAGS